MSAAVLDLWRAQVAQQVELLEGLLAKQGISLQDNSIFTFREIAARGLHRFDARLDAGPLWQQPTAQKLRLSLRDAPWVPLIRDMLGDNVTTITSAVYSRPGADAQVRPGCIGRHDCHRLDVPESLHSQGERSIARAPALACM